MDTSHPPVVVRRYFADTYAEALDAYETDLVTMASADWFPVAQSWGWDTVGSQDSSSVDPAGSPDQAFWR